VSVETESGDVIARVTASERSGFRVRVVAGRYIVSAVARHEQQSGCPPQRITTVSGKTTHVNVAMACLVP
jgi:hypothetical protein